MTQTGIALDLQRKWEDIPSLKRHLSGVQKHTIREYIREVPQLTTGGAVEVEEVSGETINAMSASKVLNVSQKTDQVGTDANFVGTIEWQDVLGNVTEATFTLDGTDTSTGVAVVAAVATARYIRSASIQADVADEVLITNVAKSEVFAVIKVGQHQVVKSGYMCPTNRDGYLGKITMDLPLVSDGAITLVVTYTPKGHTLSTTKTLVLPIGEHSVSWEPCYQLQPATKVTMTIVDAATAATVTTIAHFIEAY